MNANEVLSRAKHIIEGGRSKHGAENSFGLIAKLWSSYLQEAVSLPINITPADVAQLMVLLKVARSVCGGFNPDNFVDQAGYSAWAAELEDDKIKKSAIAEAAMAQAEQFYARRQDSGLVTQVGSGPLAQTNLDQPPFMNVGNGVKRWD